MRNLSKVLALVLSLAFVLTMFASAAFIVPVGDKVAYTDADAFDASAGKEAVRVLTALGIVKGYPEGDFQPNGDVTRAEYAKMIALAKTGKTVEDDKQFNFYDTQIVLPFVDVADGDWFKGYVNYAYLNFIVAGYGDGTMRPKNNVTGVEAVKMTLVALGYDPKIEGLEGADWARNTITLAGKTGLLKDLANENMYKAFDREATAILVYNALNEKVVAYNNGFIYYTGKTLAEESAFGGLKVAAAVADKSKVDLSKYDAYYMDGKAISLDEAKAALKDAQGSTAPVETLDGAIYFYSYNVYKVKAVDGSNMTLWGKGEYKNVVTIGEEIAADDFVVIWNSTLGNKNVNYAKKLEVVTGKVTAYTINSKDGDGLDVTKAGGKYTINGKQYTFGTLATEFDNTTGIVDESDYFAELLGKGSAAVNDAELTFIVDGSYIVAVFVNEKTYWENYAIVIGYNYNDVTLGLKHIRLLTDDNEYKDFYVASVDGNQIYNNIVSGTTTLPARNSLVRYEDLGNSKIALYNVGYANAVSEVMTDVKMEFDSFSGNWEGHFIKNESYPQQETTFTWENGIVFVTYKQDINWNEFVYVDYTVDYTADLIPKGNRYWSGAYLWRAYKYGEFQPDPADDTCISFMNNTKATVVCANSLNNNITIKAAALEFNPRTDYASLPGLPLRAGQIWGTVMSVTDIGMTTDEGAKKYAYKFNILQPWSTKTTAITVYADYKLVTVTMGDIYKLYVDADGVCRRFEIAKTAQKDLGVSNNYLEIGYWNVTNAYYSAANKGWFLTLKHPYIDNLGYFRVESDEYFMPETADAYFVQGLFGTGIKAFDYVAEIGKMGIASLINDKSWEVFADINPTTATINSIWFNKNAGSDPATYTWETTIDVYYDDANEEVTYVIDDMDNILFLDTKAKTLTVSAKPYQLLAPIGEDVPVELTAVLQENGGWYVTAISGYKWISYSGYGKGADVVAQNDIWAGDTYTLKVQNNATLKTLVYDLAATTDLVWYREKFALTSVMYTKEGDDITGTPVASLADAVDALEALDFDIDWLKNGSKSAYNYEVVYVMTGLENATSMIVCVDMDVTDAGIDNDNTMKFPYVALPVVTP